MALLVLGCSPSNEKKAQKLIGQTLKESLHDYSSYEPVSFGSLDTLFTSILEISEYSAAKEQFDHFTIFADFAKDDPSPSVTTYPDSVAFYKKIIDSLETAFIPEQIGWRMRHTFRSNNAIGAKTIGHFVFFFNNELTEVTEYKELNQSSEE